MEKKTREETLIEWNKRQQETIKTLADALEAVRDWDQRTREHPEKAWPSAMPVVEAALRLAGRLP